ncbi:MAG: acetyl-CoA hydrolase [Nocardioides sp.]|nr:acetyl-CoA hydrolase [Nocardioides sp.]
MVVVDLRTLLSSLPPDPRVVVSGNHATPWSVLAEIDAALDSYRLWVLNPQRGLPDRDGVTYETSFVGPGMRRSPRLHYTPSRLSMVPLLFAGSLPPDLVVLHTTRPRDGVVSMGIEVNVLPAAIEQTRRRGGKVLAVVNEHMPWTDGDALVDLEAVDCLVEADAVVAAAEAVAPDEDAQRIGAMVAARVSDGATIQSGIGAVPDAVLSGLTGRRGLRVWTEMFSDSVLALEEAGALDPTVPVHASFLMGSPALLDWVERTDRVRMIRTETANDPALIARQPRMVSINTALQVDLFAQANASRIGARIHSGFGGQTDFFVGAMHSPGGQGILALRSWHPKADVSTVVPLLREPVTSFQATAVITEQGVAELAGRTEREQAAALIEHAARPEARDELRAAAVELGLAD